MDPPNVIGEEDTVDGGEDVIDVVNRLQDKLVISGHTLDVNLPQIVAVGCQSAGKSSVLENIVRKEFLPRGTDVVTRRPTIVQLQPISQGETEYAEFLHNPGVRYNDFTQVKEEILNETNREPGPVGFSSKPITVRIYSPQVLKLTLVDLPGLIKNVADNQPEECIEEVREMVLQYISQPETLILAISPANQDIVNSDALNIAKIVDPKRERTIGVLTKLDLMDHGTDARDVLENKKIYLKRGYVGVLNRSQNDIETGKDINYILREEKRFFMMHPCYRHMARRMGTPYLRKMLQEQLRAHIKAFLPQVRQQIQLKYNAISKEIKDFQEGEETATNEEKRLQIYVLRQMQKFLDDITVKIMGNSEHVDKDRLSCGAQINYALNCAQKNLKMDFTLQEKDCVILITNMSGLRNEISIPTMTLETICSKLLDQYVVPVDESVDSVVKILMEAVHESAAVMNAYPTFKEEVLYRIQNYVDQETENIKNRLLEHISAEKFYVNLGHPDFDASLCEPVAPKAGPIRIWDSPESESVDTSASSSQNDSQQELLQKLTSNEQTQQKVKYLTTMATKYVEIIRKQIGDILVKYIVFFLINKVLNYIKKELLLHFIEPSNLKPLLEDWEQEFQHKQEMKAVCDSLKEAIDAIHNF